MRIFKKLNKVRFFLAAHPRRIELLLLMGLSIGLSILIGATSISERRQALISAQVASQTDSKGYRQVGPNSVACTDFNPPVPPSGCFYEPGSCTGPRDGGVCYYTSVCSRITPPTTILLPQPTFGCLSGEPCAPQISSGVPTPTCTPRPGCPPEYPVCDWVLPPGEFCPETTPNPLITQIPTQIPPPNVIEQMREIIKQFIK